ncbi:MAG: sulfite exporter TauE/SafE family protein [Planctomycetota bacterium]|nr:sulfite exporter TauE/SafE family protein [Planctomycetota bacterium]
MKRADLWLFPVGAAIAFVGALCGIGGGLFTVPILHFVRKLELKEAVATALVLVLATTGCSTITEALRPDPDLNWRLVAVVASGVLMGAQVGYWTVSWLRVRTLRMVFVVVFVLAGGQLVFGILGSASDLPVSGGAAIVSWDYLYAFAAGYLGGMAAPLLGVGGGLVMVPMLFIGLDVLDFGEARATSLAAGTVGALRGLWLHGRAGRVHLPAVLPLALGAVGGAVAGVFVVHEPGVVEVCRYVLSGILWLTAVRFVLELRRKE